MDPTTPDLTGHDHRPGHEPTDISLRPILLFVVALVATAVVIHLLLFAQLGWYSGDETPAAGKIGPLPPLKRQPTAEPRLQEASTIDLGELRRREQAELESSGWVDREGPDRPDPDRRGHARDRGEGPARQEVAGGGRCGRPAQEPGRPLGGNDGDILSERRHPPSLTLSPRERVPGGRVRGSGFANATALDLRGMLLALVATALLGASSPHARGAILRRLRGLQDRLRPEARRPGPARHPPEGRGGEARAAGRLLRREARHPDARLPRVPDALQRGPQRPARAA